MLFRRARLVKKICRNCFNFVDRDLSECPYCHKPVNGKPKKEKEEVSKVKARTKEETLAIAKTVAEASGEAEPKQKTAYFDRPKWIKKKDRVGDDAEVERKKGTHVRVKGVHIDVSSISFLQGKIGTANKYKPKTAGEEIDYRQEKLKWWEIYRYADRWLVRRAINKHVKRASVVRPERVSYWWLLFLSIFTGFVGGHSFYARNYRRGIVSLSLFSFSLTMVALMEVIPFLRNFQYSLCALPGLICVMMWAWDIVLVLIKKYKFRESKLNYIYSLDVETRARLHNKYIDVPNWYEYKG